MAPVSTAKLEKEAQAAIRAAKQILIEDEEEQDTTPLQELETEVAELEKARDEAVAALTQHQTKADGLASAIKELKAEHASLKGIKSQLSSLEADIAQLDTVSDADRALAQALSMTNAQYLILTTLLTGSPDRCSATSSAVTLTLTPPSGDGRRVTLRLAGVKGSREQLEVKVVSASGVDLGGVDVGERLLMPKAQGWPLLHSMAREIMAEESSDA